MTSDGGANLWSRTCREALPTRTLATDREADLAIVGGGFTGCAAALEAARLGARVVLLEARDVGHGGSGRNVGLVNAGLWLPPDAVVRSMGEGPGLRLMSALSQGPEAVFDIIARHAIDCDPVRNGTLHLAHAPAGLENLKNRLLQGNRLGAPLRLLDREETARRTGTPAFFGALLDPRAGTIHPLSYCRGLARAALASGAEVYAQSPVERITRRAGRWVIEAVGKTVVSRAILLATNAYHGGVAGSPRPQFVPVRYFQFATAPLPASLRSTILPGGEGCWDTALVMSSIRLDGAGRLIVGGIGDSEGPGSAVHASWARHKLRSLYPELSDFPFEHAWCGTIAMTSDHIPKIVVFGADAVSVFGYSGRGIGPGTIFGTSAARALLTGDHETLPVAPVGSHRERFKWARESYYELGAVATHWVERRRRSMRTEA
ncbi:MAG: NAD(P)/FAD-dependent oxidoreductase [Gemmobacter sp.]